MKYENVNSFFVNLNNTSHYVGVQDVATLFKYCYFVYCSRL